MSGPLRCDDVNRELAVPTAGCDPAALAEHLAACPDCAHAAERAERFDRLWRASRPPEPSDAAWDSLWAGVAAGLDAAEPVEVGGDLIEEEEHDLIPLPVAASRRWRRWGTALFGLAQAAVLLVGFGLLLTRTQPEAAASVVSVDIEPGEVVLIRGDGQVRRSEPALPDMPGDTVDGNFAMFNALEAMANNR